MSSEGSSTAVASRKQGVGKGGGVLTTVSGEGVLGAILGRCSAAWGHCRRGSAPVQGGSGGGDIRLRASIFSSAPPLGAAVAPSSSFLSSSSPSLAPGPPLPPLPLILAPSLPLPLLCLWRRQ